MTTVFTYDGAMDLEEYVARVVTNENGRADTEALKAQAIASRTYVLRAMRDDPSLGTPAKPLVNSESFQTYAAVANSASAAATRATSGVVAKYEGELVQANYVAGAILNEDGSIGDDPTGTEKWVTYNDGATGTDVRPTPLSGRRNDNRGCMSQNGANWLSKRGYSALQILRYYYGADLQVAGLGRGRALIAIGAALVVAWAAGWLE